MSKSLQKRKGTTNPDVPMPVITQVASPVVGNDLTPKKALKTRGGGAAQRGTTSRGPMA